MKNCKRTDSPESARGVARLRMPRAGSPPRAASSSLSPPTSPGRVRLPANLRAAGREPEQPAELALRYPLRLLTLKRHHSINTSYGGLPVFARAEPEPRLEIHPVDAAARSITEGTPVRVWNDRGTLTCAATITDRTMPGTVALPFGPWRHGQASVNALTSDRLSGIGHGPTFCDTLVEAAPA